MTFSGTDKIEARIWEILRIKMKMRVSPRRPIFLSQLQIL